jgi:hypothetical protein
MTDRPMSASERGNWIDTEGCVSAFTRKSGRDKGTFEARIQVVQKEKKPLEDYCNGARRAGVRCHVFYNRASNAYHAEVGGIRNVDKELTLVKRFIRTAKRKAQIRRFYKQVMAKKRMREILQGLRER